MEVTLQEMLSAREERAWIQFSLGREYGLPVISFTMNIAGPVKNTPLIARAFREGCRQLELALASAKMPLVHSRKKDAVTGLEAFYVANGDARTVKALTTKLEDELPMGRLYDMDVLLPDGTKLDRDEVQGGPRPCIVCGAPGRGCASRRVHSVEALQKATAAILNEALSRLDREKIASLAVQSLLEEACTTPKPGLVDRANSGSHRDMDIFTFLASAAALQPYFLECARIGQETREKPSYEVFPLLRAAGRQADRDMLAATGGINTHKGAIYTMGILCGAAGRLWTAEKEHPEEAALLAECGQIAGSAARADFADMEKNSAVTAGQKLYLEHGIRGIRGQVADGLPALKDLALPMLKKGLARGESLNDAGSAALLHLIAGVTDTNMVSRGGFEKAEAVRRELKALLAKDPNPAKEAIEALDAAFIRDNLSPGGCADLLAASYFVLHLCN